jgi:hypothetical protein
MEKKVGDMVCSVAAVEEEDQDPIAFWFYVLGSSLHILRVTL